jgi:hypothetical protein
VDTGMTVVIHPTPLMELGIFLVALPGFTIFYALERLAARTAPGARRRPPAGRFVPAGRVLPGSALLA